MNRTRLKRVQVESWSSEWTLRAWTRCSMLCAVLAAVIIVVACEAPSGDDTLTATSAAPQSKQSIELLLSEKESYLQIAKLAGLLDGMGPESVGPVRQILQDPHRKVDATAALLLVRFWAQHEPESATQWCVTASPVAWRGAGIEIAAGVWAQRDPLAVLEKYGHDNEYVSDALISSWFDANVPGVDEHVRSLGNTTAGQRALAVLIRKKIERGGPDAVLEWARAQQGSQKDLMVLYRKVGAELAMVDLEAAVGWCAEQCDGPYGETLRLVIARRWAEVDGAAALRWIAEAAPKLAIEKERAARGAYRIWLKSDREAALGWVRAIPEDERSQSWLQPPLAMYVSAVSWSDPHEALRWAELIQDESQRELARITIARRWRDSDLDAAEAWLESSPLSEAARQKAREHPENYLGTKRRRLMVEVPSRVSEEE